MGKQILGGNQIAMINTIKAFSHFYIYVQILTFPIFYRTIDGVSYPGVIKEKEAAQQQYQKAVSRGQSAGLVK